MPLGTAPAAADIGIPGEETLLAMATRTASGTGAAVELRAPRYRAVLFQLVVPARAGVVSDTLNVYVQQSFDGGANWDDVVSVTQVLGDAADPDQVATVPSWPGDTAGEVHARADAQLGQGTVRAVGLGRRFRVRWSIAGGTASFQFGVFAAPLGPGWG